MSDEPDIVKILKEEEKLGFKIIVETEHKKQYKMEIIL